VAEQLGDCPSGLFALVLISEREIESSAEHEPVSLVVGRQRTFSRKQVGVLRLLVEVRGIVNRFRERVAARKLNFIREPSIQGQRKAVVNRTGVVLPLVDAVE